MKLVSSKGLNTSGISTLPLKQEVPITRIPWNMSKRILVGKRSDGYQVMQALAPLFAMNWSMHITKGDKEPLKISLVDNKGKTRQSAEGTTLSVVLRRMSIGMSKQFSHMME